jgi:hypothetical protein
MAFKVMDNPKATYCGFFIWIKGAVLEKIFVSRKSPTFPRVGLSRCGEFP